MNDVEEVQRIANGGPFDIAEAVRTLARFLTLPVEIEGEPGLTVEADGGLGLVNVEPVAELAASVEVENVTGVDATELDAKYVELLAAGGFTLVTQVVQASDEQLLALKGIGDAALETIREKVG